MATFSTALLPASTAAETGQSRSSIGCFACALLVLACIVDQGLGPLDVLEWPGVTAALLVIMGLPHGALDIELLISAADDPERFPLTRSLVGYVGIVVGMLLLWWLLPVAALVLMLLLSAYHFGGDWLNFTHPVERVIVGATLLSAPALFHQASVAQIFSWLVSSDGGAVIAGAMHFAAIPLLVVAAAVLLLRWQDRRAQCEEITIVISAAVVLPPLTFFVIYFCALHSVRHLVDVRRTLSAQRVSLLVARGAPYAVIALVGCAAGALFFSQLPLGAAFLSSVFIGLAALTVPHMIVCELPQRAAGAKSIT